jgi:CheY-like chemotaxis protein
VDPTELELVILNLCVNARDAMPQGGLIIIAGMNAGSVNEGELKGDFVMLTVTDTGRGMTQEVLARIFEPFFTTKEIGKGSGLGLPQVHGFAQQSGGTVTVESQPNLGTRVTLFLPRSEIAPAPLAEAQAELHSSGAKPSATGSILLVEDDNEVATLVGEMLRELGYRVTHAASAQAALGALADDRDIKLVFSDVMMPGLANGFQLAHEIRRRRPEVAILLTTGYAGESKKPSGLDWIDVLAKPYEVSDLEDAIQSALSK